MNTIENIKKLLKETGLKQYVLAERCGYTPKTFSQLVNGKKTITDIDVIKLCKGLNVEPNDLIVLNN